MNEFKEAEELFQQKNLSQAKEILLKIIEKNSDLEVLDSSYNLLIKIYLSKNDSNLTRIQEEYIDFLFEKKKYNKVISNSLVMKDSKQSLKIRRLVRESLWKVGQSEKYIKDSISEIKEFLVSKKYFYAEKVITDVTTKIKSNSEISLCKILFFSDIGENEKLIKEIEDLLIIVRFNSMTKKRKEKVALNLCEILKLNHDTAYLIQREKLFWTLLSKETNEKSKILELILSSMTEVKYLVNMVYFLEDDLAFDLAKYIMNLSEYTFDLIKFQPQLKKYFSTRPVMAVKSTNKIEETPLDWEQEENENYVPAPITHETDKYRTLSIFEKELIHRIKFKDELIVENAAQLIIPLITMELYEVAKDLILCLPDGNEKKYLLATVNLELNNISEVISLSNEVLEEMKDAVEFLYLKALAYEKNGDDVEANSLYWKIAGIDPEFRNVKEKIGR